MIDLLERLQFGIEKDGEALTAVVPSYRGDCTELSDIAEEVARIYGYENIPSTRPAAPISKGETGFRHEVNERISTILSRAGLNETVTFSFMHPDQLQKLLFTESDPAYQAVPILNPITEDFPLMRTTLIPTLMDVVVRNQAVKNAPSASMNRSRLSSQTAAAHRTSRTGRLRRRPSLRAADRQLLARQG